MNQQLSSTKLNSTETILTSLYEKLMRNQSPIQRQDKRFGSSDNGLKMSTSMMNHTTQSPDLRHQFLMSQHNEQLCINQQQFKHEHTKDCCIISNMQIKQRLKKVKKNQFLLQTYKEQVEYLKKLSLLQSEEIEKLRRMLRIQNQRSYHTELNQNNKQWSENNRKQIQSCKKMNSRAWTGGQKSKKMKKLDQKGKK